MDSTLTTIKVGYTDSYNAATELSLTPDIVANALGYMEKASTLNYIYLFIPSIDVWVADSAPEWILDYVAGRGHTYTIARFSNIPSYITVEQDGGILITGSYTIHYDGGGEGGDSSETTSYGYVKYRVSVGKNDDTNPRTGTFNATFSVSVDGGIWYNDLRTLSVTIKQLGKSSLDDPTTDTNFYYRLDTLLTDYNAPLTQYNVISVFPQTLNDSYSKKKHDDGNINAFRYIYIRTIDLLATSLTGYSEVSWARIISIYVQNSPNLNVFEIQVDANNTEYIRNAVLSIKNGGNTIVNISLVQYTVDNPEIPIIPPDADEAEDKYWEGEGTTGNFVITDTNEGALIDPTLLLFKSNYANIYNTIEQKDGTLFLGNYINENTINNVHDIMNLYINTEKIITSNGTRKVPVNLSGASDYKYIPNMTLNSLQKRIFKYGETYALGLVFVYKTGRWSSVYYLGDTKGKWSPLSEPVLEHPDDNVFYRKPVRYCALSLDVTNALSSIGVVAVIPVYAVKNSHRVMCQGFLSPTLKSSARFDGESIEALYSWFYRDLFQISLDTPLPSGVSGGRESKEILNLDANTSSPWVYNRQICSLNTPEVEVDEVLSDAMLANASCRSVKNYTEFTYANNILLNVNGKYLKSYFSSADVYRDGKAVVSVTSRRVITGYFWHGFFNNGYNSQDGTLLNESNKEENYKWFAVYPWQRATIGGEGPTSQITNKRLFNSLYTSGLAVDGLHALGLHNIIDTAIYRDFDTASIIRVGSSIYQGNTDYIVVTEAANAYKAWTDAGEAPHAHADDGNYAGYDTKGNITDPISIKYKAAPHIAIKFDGSITFDETASALFCVELYNPTPLNEFYKTNILDLQGYQWIKCGDLKRILPTEQTTLIFEEGDYFFGRFDSLRTYCYTEEDVNSVVEVVSGMLCSRVNLDARCDRNRGVRTPTVSPVNFNIFNPVYNQLNNYFTFSYINQGDIVYKRKYGNSIQWSLTKEYGSDVDNWCNILDINTLDFDGDKGEIQSITKLGNNLIVFQDTGISQIQYNEKTLIATSEGVPIEIGNSNKVDGKYYLYDNIGCQYKGSISKSPSGIYFVDSINRTLYLLGLNAEIKDLCTIGGMKSWGLANLDRKWWSYYDINSQEVLFANDVEALAYSDSYQRFNAFLGYGGIRWNFRTNDRTVQICPSNFTLVISTASPTINSSKRVIDVTKNLENITNTFWKKNSINETKFFGNNSPIELQLHCNPEPTLDKTFCVVEYRMDCFDENDMYLPEISFDTFRAWNEYQDTLETSLKYKENQIGPVYSKVYSTRLRKKFRIWRIDMPRAYYGNTVYIPGLTDEIDNLGNIVPVLAQLSGQSSGKITRDRIRNPWCNIYLKFDTSNANKVVFNDLSIQYFK